MHRHFEIPMHEQGDGNFWDSGLQPLVGNLIERKVGLLSLNDPIDTTSAQGRLVFNLFASLAEFERELIRERTQAGLSAARARGRMGGRPKGLTPRAESARKASGVRDNGNTGISTTKVATLLLTLRIENNSKFVRGKKRTIEHIEHFYLDEYDAQRRSNGEYELKVPYDSDAELDDTVNELLSDIASGADDRHCFSESEVHMEGTDRYW